MIRALENVVVCVDDSSPELAQIGCTEMNAEEWLIWSGRESDLKIHGCNLPVRVPHSRDCLFGPTTNSQLARHILHLALDTQ